MKFYRVHHRRDGDESEGYSWHTSERDARRVACGAEVERIEIEPTRAGILRALNTYAEHADNG